MKILSPEVTSELEMLITRQADSVRHRNLHRGEILVELIPSILNAILSSPRWVRLDGEEVILRGGHDSVEEVSRWMVRTLGTPHWNIHCHFIDRTGKAMRHSIENSQSAYNAVAIARREARNAGCTLRNFDLIWVSGNNSAQHDSSSPTISLGWDNQMFPEEEPEMEAPLFNEWGGLFSF